MSHVVVTVELYPNERVDLALPLNVPNQVLAPTLAKALELTEDESKGYLLSVKTEDGIVRLSSNTTLGEAGILDGFILQLHRWEGASSKVEPSTTKAFLQIESGEAFPLSADSNSIGRKDIKRGVLIDIDLTPFDSGKITSRRHAIVERKQDQYILIDQGSVNGTWLNSEKLEAQKAYALKNGDVLVFGKNGVEMKFNLPYIKP